MQTKISCTLGVPQQKVPQVGVRLKTHLTDNRVLTDYAHTYVPSSSPRPSPNIVSPYGHALVFARRAPCLLVAFHVKPYLHTHDAVFAELRMAYFSLSAEVVRLVL